MNDDRKHTAAGAIDQARLRVLLGKYRKSKKAYHEELERHKKPRLKGGQLPKKDDNE